MKAEIDKPENRGYADNGIPAFKEAVARFMQRTFGVTLDPATEINHCIGSKPALAMISACFINPGDVTLMTVPGYPVAGTHTKYYGGEVHRLPLLPQNGYYPDLDGIPADVRKRAKLLVINYPNSPTGRVATPAFYEKVVKFARDNDVVVVQDAAHTVLTYEGAPLSFLSVPGAKDGRHRDPFAVEGLRHDRLAHRLVLRPQDARAGAGRREGQQRLGPVHRDPEGRRRRARRRVDPAAHEGEVRAAPAEARRDAEALRLHVRDARRHLLPLHAGAEGHGRRPHVRERRAASQHLIRDYSIVTVPWDDAGPHLRFSVTYEAADERAEDALMAAAEERLKQIRPVF
jgi:LL-diaminopimelate aminotransferase